MPLVLASSYTSVVKHPPGNIPAGTVPTSSSAQSVHLNCKLCIKSTWSFELKSSGVGTMTVPLIHVPATGTSPMYGSGFSSPTLKFRARNLLTESGVIVKSVTSGNVIMRATSCVLVTDILANASLISKVTLANASSSAAASKRS